MLQDRTVRTSKGARRCAACGEWIHPGGRYVRDVTLDGQEVSHAQTHIGCAAILDAGIVDWELSECDYDDYWEFLHDYTWDEVEEALKAFKVKRLHYLPPAPEIAMLGRHFATSKSNDAACDFCVHERACLAPTEKAAGLCRHFEGLPVGTEASHG